MTEFENDHILRATVGGGAARIFVAKTKQTVETARGFHNTSPVISAAFGRLLTASLIMGQMQKNEEDLLTVQIKCDGPVSGILTTANSCGHVKGYPVNPVVDLPLKSNGKLDVSGSIGQGELTVIKDLGLKEPYIGKIPIVSGEVAEDIAYYFAKSEQTPTVVSLGVLVDRDYSIKQSGGFIIQLLPDADEDIISKFEKKIEETKSITEMFESGMTTKDILDFLCEEIAIDEISQSACSYRCDCNVSRVEKAIISIGKEEIENIINEDESAEIKCHFCDKTYNFSKEDLISLLNNAK